jgi:hypothetical protein
MYAQGMTPYVDFWQHHLPMIWVLTAPMVRWIGPSPAIYLGTRCFAVLLTLVIAWLGWRIARRIWGEEAGKASYALLLLAGVGFSEFARLRADLPMVLLLLAGVLSVLRMAEGRRWSALWAGFFLALGLTFTVKHYLTMLLPAVVIFTDGHRDHRRRLLLWTAGAVVGALPLAFFVLQHGVVREFLHWVLRFNSGKTVANASVPIGLIIASIVGIALLLARHRQSPRATHTAILVAFGMASWTSLFAVPQAFSYYLNYWMVLAAALGAGISVPRFLGAPGRPGAPSPAGDRIANLPIRRRWRFIATGGFLVILTAPNLFLASTSRPSILRDELTRMRLLLNVADRGTVFWRALLTAHSSKYRAAPASSTA